MSLVQHAKHAKQGTCICLLWTSGVGQQNDGLEYFPYITACPALPSNVIYIQLTEAFPCNFFYQGTTLTGEQVLYTLKNEVSQ